MAEFWKALPSWVRNVVVPILVIVLAWQLLTGLLGIVLGALGFLFKALVLVGLAAAVVVLVKKAAIRR